MTSEDLSWIRKFAKINKAVVGMTNNSSLDIDEEDIKELLEMVPKESNNKELLKLEQESIAEEEAREKETAEKGKRTLKEIRSEELSRSFRRPRQAP